MFFFYAAILFFGLVIVNYYFKEYINRYIERFNRAHTLDIDKIYRISRGRYTSPLSSINRNMNYAQNKKILPELRKLRRMVIFEKLILLLWMVLVVLLAIFL